MRTIWMLWPFRALVTGLALCLALTAPAVAAEEEAEGPRRFCANAEGELFCISMADFNSDLCGALEMLAGEHGMPAGFFARLIWQESRFDPNAVSPAGAEGIAQFIPSTARLRSLSNPFNPAEALARSAEYLAEMAEEFGNLGLAAVGYNAGENRARSFISGQPFMPGETRHYVRVITGLSVEDWRKGPEEAPDFALAGETSFENACLDLAKNARLTAFQADQGDWKPWGVQLGSHFSRDVAERIFERVQAEYAVLADEEPIFVPERNRSFGARARITVRVGRDTREEGQALCTQIRQAGGFCLVERN